MKIIATIAGVLLGALFVMAGVLVLFNLVSDPNPPKEGTPPALFMGALEPTGYLSFVKVLEIVGGVLVAIPKTRNVGLLVLGPIIVNIIAFHVFITKGEGLFSPMLLAICALALFLLWVERRAFGALVRRPPAAT